MFSLRTLTLVILISFKSVLTQALCLDPVPNEYLITTSVPDLVLTELNNLNLKTSYQNVFIFDHRTSNLKFLQTKTSRPQLDVSTLILKLSKQQLSKIKSLQATTVEPNCYVDSEVSLQSQPSGEVANSVQSFNFNDTFNARQWYLDFLNYEIPDTQISNQKIKIAISDTGFDLSHEDLKNSIWQNSTELNGRPNYDDDENGCIDDFYGCDVADNDNSVEVNRYKSNLVEHGTHVAGLIGAVSNNGIGISGVTNHVELILVKTFSSHRKTTTSDLLKSIYYSVKSKADIINCSWGSGSRPTTAEFNAFEFARKNNTIVIVAAGNSSVLASNTTPAGLSNVLTVGSHNSLQQLSTFSNFGSAVDLLAPGGDGFERKNELLISLSPNNSYTEKRGTSMSAPLVAGSLAVIKSYYPTLTRNELLNILLLSSDKKETYAFFDPKFKSENSILNLNAALKMAKTYSLGLTNELNYEPKKITKPQEIQREINTQTSNSDAASNQSGCQNSFSQSSKARLNLIFFLIPILLIIKKRTSKEILF